MIWSFVLIVTAVRANNLLSIKYYDGFVHSINSGNTQITGKHTSSTRCSVRQGPYSMDLGVHEVVGCNIVLKRWR